MANETIIEVPARLFYQFSGKPITAFPDAGAILTETKVQPEATVAGLLNGGVVAVINGSKLREVVATIATGSQDEAFFRAAAELQSQGSAHSLNVKYSTSEWLSNAIWITSFGTRTITVDGVDFITVTMQGVFKKFTTAGFTAPPEATREQIEALIPAS